MLITVSGPAGTGKSQIAKELVKEFDYHPIILCTTRPKRPGEIHGKDYYFFDTIKDFNTFKEYGQLMNIESYPGNRFYALKKSDIEKAIESDERYVLVCTPRCIREIEREFNTDSIYKIYITSSLNVRATRYIERLGESFSLDDLNELVDRSNMDFGKFDGFELEADIILDNSKNLTKEEMKEYISDLDTHISSNLKKDCEYDYTVRF